MPGYNDERASYNSAVLNQKRNLINNNGALVNPSISNANSFSTGNAFNTIVQPKGRGTTARANVTDEELKKSRSGWQTFWDQIGDFGNQITKGVLNFCDGIGDFFGWIVGGIAEASGNQQLANDVKNNWINVDWINPTVAAFDMATNPSHLMSGDIFTGDYWKKFGELGDVLSGNGADTQLMKDFTENRGWLKDSELYNVITEGIGSVVPSIVLGILSGGSSLAVQAAATLIPLGVSAFGNEAQTALENDATFGQAGAAGAIGSSIEIGTELISAGLGKGINAVTSGMRKTATEIGKGALKAAIKDMAVEGLEEVASELLNPLARAVYDDKAFEAYTTSEGRQQLLKDSAMAFAGGFIGAAVGQGIGTAYARSKFGGRTGVQLAQDYQEIAEIKQKQIKEYQKGANANQTLIEEYNAQIKELGDKLSKNIESFKSSEPTNFKKYANSMLNIKQTLSDIMMNDKELEDGVKERIKYFQTNVADLEAQDITAKTKGLNANGQETKITRANLQQKGGDLIHGYSKGSSEIKISTKENTKFYNKVAHELSHTITNQASEKTFNDIYVRFKQIAPEKMTKYQKMIIENYIDDYKGSVVYKSSGKIDYAKTVKNINKNANQRRTLMSESMAHMLENTITDRKSLNKLLNANASQDAKFKSKLLATLTSIKNKFSKSESSKIINTINDAIKEIKNHDGSEAKLNPKLAYSKENLKAHKQAQLDIVKKENPAQDGKHAYHTWIRDLKDIKTFEEALQDSDYKGWEEDGFDPDYTGEDAKAALESGKITVYSSKEIKNGNFVTPSKMEAESYSGNGKVYSKVVNLNDVAWIDPTQGQYAKVEETNYSKSKQFTNIKNTTQLLDNTIDNINSKLGENTYVELPNVKSKLESKVFTAINTKTQTQAQVNALMDMFKKANVMSMDSATDSFKSIGTVQELLTEEQAASLNKELVNAIEEMRKGGTVDLENNAIKALKKTIDRLGHDLKENTPRIKTVHNIGKLKTFIPQAVKENFTITDDTITKQGLDFLMTPFAKMKYDSNGKGYRTNGMRESINNVLHYYTEEKFSVDAEHPMGDTKTVNLPFNPAIRYNLEQILEQIPTKNSTFDAKTLRLIEQTMRMIKRDSAAARFRELTFRQPFARNTVKAINLHSKDSALKKIFRAYNRAFLPAYMQNRLLTGQMSTLSEVTSTQMINATNNRTLLIGDTSSKIYEQIKKLNVKKDLARNFTLKVNGHEMKINGSELVNLYNHLNTQENFDIINENGLKREVNKTLNSKPEDFTFVKGHAQELLDAINTEIKDTKIADIAKYLKTMMNGEIKEMYKSWFVKKYGQYNYLNTVDDYWTLSREGDTVSSAEKAMKAPRMFQNSQSRVSNTHPVLVTDAFDTVGSYVNDLATYMYVMPVYRDAIALLNTKVDGKTVADTIRTTYGQKDLDSLMKSLNDIAGVKGAKDGFFSKLTGKYSVAKLSLNVSTMLKQFASIWTSNIPLRSSAKAIFNRFNGEFRSEYRQLVDEIGGLKYREGITTNGQKISAVQAGETNAAAFKNKALNKIAEVGMKGISKVDLFTVATGVYSLMTIAQNEGFKVGTKENMDFVKEHWTEFEASQISNNAMSKNALSRGDYGSIMKAMFGFMQGANRAAYASQINKVSTWLRNKGKNEVDINNRFSKAKENYTKLKTQYDETYKQINDFESNFDNQKLIRKVNLTAEEANELNEYRALQDKLTRIGEEMSNAREEYETARLEKTDYARYKVMGKNSVPVSVAAGLITQGLFVTLITELFSHIKGKKDWDEWDIQEIAKSFAINTLFSWVPVVNAIVSAMQGNGFNYGGLGMVEEIYGGYDAIRTYIENPNEYNKAKMIRMLVSGAGDLTGIPAMTLFDYTYGTIKAFNPDIAWDMKDVFYYQSESTSRDKLNEYIEKGDMDKAAKMVKTIMKHFRNSEISDSLAREMAELMADGYSCMPSNAPKAYTNGKGETVEMTADQIAQFNQYYYEKANTMVEKMTTITEYHKANKEERAKLIKRVYDAYYDAAMAKVTKQTSGMSKVSMLIYRTNIRNIPQIFGVLTTASKFADTKNKTRKELVLDYINKLKGYSRQQKTLLMFLAGYSVSGESKNVLINYLTQSGMSRNEAKEYIG